ncbi:MAG: DUF3662 domain-containing protein, partial [Kineosporiaceae bacterium]
MGVLDRFEKGIERAVNGAFAKAFRSEVQPVEIASALRRECDDRAAVMGRDRTIVPNTFVVELSQADSDRLADWKDALSNELRGALHEHAVQQRYAFVGPVSVTFERADDLDTGVFRIRSSTTNASAGPAHAAPASHQEPLPSAPPSPAQPAPRPSSPLPAGPYAPGQPPAGGPPQAGPPPGALLGGPPAYPSPAGAPASPGSPYPGTGAAPAGATQPPWNAPSAPGAPEPGAPSSSTATLDVDGQLYQMRNQVTVIGRATEADIVLDDPGVSRRHAEVHL